MTNRTPVLMVNTGKTTPIPLVCDDPRLSVCVITEPRYERLYPSHVDVRLVEDVADLDAVARAAFMVLTENGIERIIAPSERTVLSGAYLRSVLGLPGTQFDTANSFTNKYVMKTRLTEAGIATAEFRSPGRSDGIADAADDVGYPVVVKPAIGTGAQHTFVSADRDHLTGLIGSPKAAGLVNARCRVLVERYVEMAAEYHVDAVVRGGRADFMCISKYFTPLLGQVGGFSGSYHLPPGHPDEAPLRRLHSATVAALGLTDGVTHLEVFRTADAFLVGEIACRPAGGGIVPAIRLATGVDLWRAFIDLELGREPVLEGTPNGRIVANCHLPIRAGRVVRVSTADQLRSIPGVIDVEMSVRAGDIIDSQLHSSSTTGVVYLATSDEAGVADRVALLRRRYVLDVRPSGGA